MKKLNINEKIPIVKQLIDNKDPDLKPNIITVYSISKCFNVSFLEATIILNQFVLNESDISIYVIFFLCDIIDDEGKCFTKKVISSCDENVNTILEDKKHTLGYGVFGICNLNEYYLMDNYRPFVGENILIKRFDFSNVPQDVFMGLNEVKPVETKKKKSPEKTKSVTKNEKNNKYIITDKEEENYYGGFVPKPKAKTDKDKVKIDLKKDNKRKRSESSESSNSSKGSINKGKGEKKKTKEKKQIIMESPIEEKPVEDDVNMKDEISEGEKKPKKIRKTRLIKKTKTFMNEEGYLVTKDIMEEEEYWSDEKPEKKNKIESQRDKPEPKKNKKIVKGQTSLTSFFK